MNSAAFTFKGSISKTQALCGFVGDQPFFCPGRREPSPRSRRLPPILKIFGKGDGSMTKNELITMVSDKAQINKNDAAKAVEATFDIITGALKQGDEVKLVGFGSFTVSQRKAREGRNPRTGQPV